MRILRLGRLILAVLVGLITGTAGFGILLATPSTPNLVAIDSPSVNVSPTYDPVPNPSSATSPISIPVLSPVPVATPKVLPALPIRTSAPPMAKPIPLPVKPPAPVSAPSPSVAPAPVPPSAAHAYADTWWLSYINGQINSYNATALCGTPDHRSCYPKQVWNSCLANAAINAAMSYAKGITPNQQALVYACGFTQWRSFDFNTSSGANNSQASKYFYCSTCSSFITQMGASWAISSSGRGYLVVLAGD